MIEQIKKEILQEIEDADRMKNIFMLKGGNEMTAKHYMGIKGGLSIALTIIDTHNNENRLNS